MRNAGIFILQPQLSTSDFIFLDPPQRRSCRPRVLRQPNDKDVTATLVILPTGERIEKLRREVLKILCQLKARVNKVTIKKKFNPVFKSKRKENTISQLIIGMIPSKVSFFKIYCLKKIKSQFQKNNSQYIYLDRRKTRKILLD